jgi:hypothetical protein
LRAPTEKADADAGRALAARLGVKVGAGALRSAGEVVHVLSHREMRVQVLVGDLRGDRRAGAREAFAPPGPEYAAVERVPFAELRAPHTRPYGSLTRKVLDMANVPWRGLP